MPFADDDGPLVVQAIPYADPIDVRATLDEPEIQTHEQAMQALVARARAVAPAGARTVLVGHAFVAGAQVSDSERPLTVGGAGTVPASVFDGFDYVALGHLHRPQSAGADAVRYAGSLLTYSFNEVTQHKSVSIVEIGAPGSGVPAAGGRRRGSRARAGARRRSATSGAAAGEAGGAPPASPAAARVTVEQVELRPRRRVRVIEGTLHDILERGPGRPGARRLRLRAPHRQGRPAQRHGPAPAGLPQLPAPRVPQLELRRRQAAPVADPATRSEGEHFAAFFEYVTDEQLSAAERGRLRGRPRAPRAALARDRDGRVSRRAISLRRPERWP